MGPKNRSLLVVAGVAAALFLAVSMGGAFAIVARHDWLGVGDLKAMAIWTGAGALVLLLAVRLLVRFTSRIGLVATFIAHGVGAVLFAVGWMAVLIATLGPWVGAFSFPVATLWLVGALTGLMGAALLLHGRGWLLATVVFAVPLAASLLFVRAAQSKPADIIIVLKPHLLGAQRERLWCEAFGHPSPFGIGCTPLAGIQTTAAFDGDGESRYRIGFQPGTTRRRRDEIVGEIRRSPLVDRVEDYDSRRHGIVELPPD